MHSYIYLISAYLDPSEACFGHAFLRVDLDCLYLGEQPTSWYEAKQQCRHFHGNLVEIADVLMHSHVMRVIVTYGSMQKYWIGLSRDGGWQWENGKSHHHHSDQMLALWINLLT